MLGEVRGETWDGGVKLGATPRHARGWYRMHKRTYFGLESLVESLVIVCSSLFVTPPGCGYTLVTMATPQGVMCVPRHPFRLKNQEYARIRDILLPFLYPACIMIHMQLKKKLDVRVQEKRDE